MDAQQTEQKQGQQQQQGQAQRSYQSPDKAPQLNEQEQKEVEERSAVSAHVVYGAIQKEGEEELERSSSALAWSGLAAGLSMGFSLVGEGLLRAALPDEPWRPLVTKLGYSLGFLIVILGRQQLFTENTLTPVLPLLSEFNRRNLLNTLRLWGVVLAANLIGALLFAWAISSLNVFEPEVRRAFADIGRDALKSDFLTVLIRGIFAGWLIALLVWLLPFAETARVVVIIIITFLVGLAGFSHVIAGSVEAMYAAFTGTVSWSTALLGYTLPSLIGNTIGGVTLVAALAHAQVVAGDNGSDA
jgi:formate/nitrite transporter FocA (FNT family)